jgi:hypothetical protein
MKRFLAAILIGVWLLWRPSLACAAYVSASGSVTLGINWSAAQANTGDLQPTSTGQQFSSVLLFTGVGAGANDFDQIFCQERTLTASSSETLDLVGSLTDFAGNTINFARVKVIAIELPTYLSAASGIKVGNATTHPFLGPLLGTTPTETVSNGGFWVNGRTDATGWTVTSGTNDQLKLLNLDASNSAVYRITLFGSAE